MTSSTLHEPSWRVEHRMVIVGGQPHTLRLVAFERGWLASVDTVAGPTLGANHSPYLAAGRALEPLGVDVGAAMTLVGPVSR